MFVKYSFQEFYSIISYLSVKHTFVEKVLENDYDTNLQITSIFSRLAQVTLVCVEGKGGFSPF